MDGSIIHFLKERSFVQVMVVYIANHEIALSHFGNNKEYYHKETKFD